MVPRAVPGLVRFSALATVGCAHGSRFYYSTTRGRHLGQPKIQDFGVSALGYEDVSRFNVAMDNTLGVRRLERFGNVDAERQ